MHRTLVGSLLAGWLLSACGASQSADTEQTAQPTTSDYTQAVSETSETTTTKPSGTQQASAIDDDPYGPPNKDGYYLIDWDDLMPEGEIDVLNALFQEFYAEQERAWQEQQSLLSDGTGYDSFGGIQEGGPGDTMTQIGTFNVVEEMNGMKIRLPGYVVPLDFGAKDGHDEFILVPYFGACLHSPPPPPNQTLLVTADPAAKIDSIFRPVWVEGTLKTGEYMTGVANSAYELILDKVEPYE